MKVKELIERLKELNQEANVVFTEEKGERGLIWFVSINLSSQQSYDDITVVARLLSE